jgi:MYXO-CTERM domain-containing protein
VRILAALIVLTTIAHAAPPPPSGAHPRILLNDVRPAWRAQASEEHGPVKGAIALCDEARTTREHDHAVYQGSEWAKVLQACLVAWAATDSNDHAQTAIRFMTALLDDLDEVGDGKGGDAAARRDDGYAIRNLGPYTALAYDWLYDKLTPAQRDHAKARWKAWLDWYADKGYRHDDAGSNYHAGYVIAATFMAIALGNEDPALWTRVADTLWGKELIPAIADGGVLDGGDWPEGWQYGPLAVAEIALGARAMRGAGVEVPNVSQWLSAMFRHHVYALSPSDRMFAGEDTESETPNLEPSVLAYDAIALGDGSPDDRKWARGELSRLQLADRDYLLYDALAGVGDHPQLAPRTKWPTWYVTAGTGTLFARTRWDDSAVWFVAKCHASIDLDHRHPDAGNFVLSRGKDDVIVDPSPYGTRSTLTSNAPTVVSPQLPASYKPSQGYWSERTGWDFATQRASGVVAARCDYADQYKFQERPSDVSFARRDFVLVPTADGKDAQLVLIDRAQASEMNLRFRTPGTLALAGTTATATVGGSKLVVEGTSPATIAGPPPDKDCFKDEDHKGSCTAARFPVNDYRVDVAGPAPASVHVIAAIASNAAVPKQEALGSGEWSGVHLSGLRDAVVVWRTPGATGPFSYSAPKANAMTHVILDAPAQDGKATVTAKPDGDHCAVSVTAGGTMAIPPIVTLDGNCNVQFDPEAPAQSAVRTRASRGPGGDPRSARGGCCGAEAAPGSSAAMSAVVLGLLFVRRRRR